MNTGSTQSFLGLFDQVSRVSIPVIQRDYAQGGDAYALIRDRFLDRLAQVFGDTTDNLDLDFVYGSKVDGVLSVLDGQQRLTSLFLLHWYLAAIDGNLDEFREVLSDQGESRFTYQTRQSSTDFLNQLVDAEFDVDFRECELISEEIEDQHWFFGAWELDPTVSACLSMLDAIHEKFQQTEGLYERLCSSEDCPITFQYLELEEFDLTDELYVKMNARGKALTAFENFKASLINHIAEHPDLTTIELLIDQDWTDFFWSAAEEPDDFDEIALRSFHLLALFEWIANSEVAFARLAHSDRLLIDKLRSSSDLIPFTTFETKNLFSIDHINAVRRMMTVLSGANTDVRQIFIDILRDQSADYIELLEFYCLYRFIMSNDFEVWDNEIETKFTAWQRVTSNLINNTRMDERERFYNSLRVLYALSFESLNIYEYLATNDETIGSFTPAQVEEERLKSGLILDDASWIEPLVEIESHYYLKGHVGFVLEHISKDGQFDVAQFLKVGRKACELLNRELLSDRDYPLQRALLCLGDYTLSSGAYTFSLCSSTSGNYRDRNENWLSVVKEPVFGVLLDHIIEGSDTKVALYSLIDECNCGGWRQLMVENPATIAECLEQKFNRSGEYVCLLTKKTMASYHSELKSTVLYRTLNVLKENDQLPDWITKVWYQKTYGEETPYMTLEHSGGRIYVHHGALGWYATTIDANDDEVSVEIPEDIVPLCDRIDEV